MLLILNIVFFRVLLTLALLPQVPGVASHGPLTPNLLQVDLHPDYLDHAETKLIMLIMQISMMIGWCLSKCFSILREFLLPRVL